MNVIMCAIARTENQYINEWCHYYLDMGFSKIYLYDNNNDEDDFVGDFIDENIRDKIEIINVHNQANPAAQGIWYAEFYAKHGNEFDWVALFDIDEFLDLAGECNNNINEFLAQDKFKNFQQIMFRWRLFGDDGCVDRDRSIPVHKFFKRINDDREPANRMLGKTIIRGKLGLTNSKIQCHATQGLRSCYPSGREMPPMLFYANYTYNNEKIFLNHYRTKTLAEFMETKLIRQNRICGNCAVSLRQYYFKANEWTQEKQDFADKWLKEHDIDPEVHYDWTQK